MDIQYANGKPGRVIVWNRPNTSFQVMTMDGRGNIYHHTKDGKNNLDGAPSDYDVELPDPPPTQEGGL